MSEINLDDIINEDENADEEAPMRIVESEDDRRIFATDDAAESDPPADDPERDDDNDGGDEQTAVSTSLDYDGDLDDNEYARYSLSPSPPPQPPPHRPSAPANSRVLDFRHYRPRDQNLKHKILPKYDIEADEQWLNDELYQIVQSALVDPADADVSVKHRPLNADVRRFIQPQIKQLKTQTQRAISQIIKDTIARQQTQNNNVQTDNTEHRDAG